MMQMKMTRKRAVSIFVMGLLLLLTAVPARMQDVSGQLAATLEVIAPGVEVQRVNTVNWIAVQVEAIVGVGDVIRTDETGKARITFFADGVDTEIQPDSQFRIERFEGNNTSFRLLASLLLGQSIQRVGRVLDADSSYDIQTPGMELTVRGTEFVVRVEDSGRSAVLVTEGTAVASAEDGSADVSAGFGTRADANGVLSDVVVAASFDQLDAALDGCAAGVVTVDDVRLNVRLGPSIDFPRVGTADGADIDRFYGVSASGGWYRIAFSDNFGWVLASDTSLDPECAGLRVFPDTQAEDPALYGELGDAITLDDLKLPPATPPAPPETTGQGAG